MSYKHKVTIAGIKHFTNSTSKFNHLKKCRKMAEWLMENDLNYEKGFSQFGYQSPETFRRALALVGFKKTRTSKFFLSKVDLIKTIDRHQKGETIEVIASDFGMSKQLLTIKQKAIGYSPLRKRYDFEPKKEDRNLDNKYKAMYDRILYNSTLTFQ